MTAMHPQTTAKRVMIIGDSITDYAKTLPNKSGYYYQFNEALAESGAPGAVDLITLGFHGQSITMWPRLLKESYTENREVRNGVMLKDEFDRGADVLIIFLGGNDNHAPYVTLATVGEWKKKYRCFINDLRKRTKFTRLILATPTLFTENPETYRSRLMRKQAGVIRELAHENDAALADVQDACIAAWKFGRMSDPHYTMTSDNVHPKALGHGIIAAEFLQVLGYEKAAGLLRDRIRRELGPIALMQAPGMLLHVLNSDRPNIVMVKGETANIEVEQIHTELPESWRLEHVERNGSEFILSIQGKVEKLENRIRVIAAGGGKTTSQILDIYAPWLVSSGMPGRAWSDGHDFSVAKQQTPVDAAIEQGMDFRSVPGVEWLIYYPNADVVGGDDPDSVDFASYMDSALLSQCFMVRYLHTTGGKAELILARNFFSGDVAATAYLNGQRVFADHIPKEKKRDSVIVDLNPGWNILAVKCSHTKWQFQLSVSLAQVPGGADLGRLQYRVDGI